MAGRTGLISVGGGQSLSNVGQTWSLVQFQRRLDVSLLFTRCSHFPSAFQVPVDQILPMLAEFGPRLAKRGEMWALARLDELGADVGEHPASFCRLRPNLINVKSR